MNIELIIRKGQSGESLCTEEIEGLMIHAIDLLKFINQQTQESIARAHELLASQYKKAA